MKARDRGEPYQLRWHKNKRVCCVPFCTSDSKAEKHSFSWDVICHSIGIANISSPVDTCTSLCSAHYIQVYRTQHDLASCVCCGVLRINTTATFITCPSPKLVESYLRDTIDFTGTIREGDQLCYSCYKFFNRKLKSGECMLSSEEVVQTLEAKQVELQIKIVEFQCMSTESHVNLCLCKTALSACELLASNRAFLFPDIYRHFMDYM